jgi:hypothetical protein
MIGVSVTHFHTFTTELAHLIECWPPARVVARGRGRYWSVRDIRAIADISRECRMSFIAAARVLHWMTRNGHRDRTSAPPANLRPYLQAQTPNPKRLNCHRPE